MRKSQTLNLNPPESSCTDPVGIGLRAPHYQEIIDSKPALGWLEVHPENYFGGGVHRHFLSRIREDYPVSMHAVGLSLGSDQPLEVEHLRQFKELIDIYDPFLISDHVSWSASGNAHMNDLLPLPYTNETLARLCQNIDQAQTYFRRRILVENPSTYIAFKGNEMPECEFMNMICSETGCGMLLDINNIFVQSHNHNLDPIEYINNIDGKFVGEMHLGGHIEKSAGASTILVDSHNQCVRDEVWALYEHAVSRFGAIPTLIEWDQDFPELGVLLKEASKARNIINSSSREHLDAAE